MLLLTPLVPPGSRSYPTMLIGLTGALDTLVLNLIVVSTKFSIIAVLPDSTDILILGVEPTVSPRSLKFCNAVKL